MKQLQLKHWQDPVIALLGAWLAVSPWALGYAAHPAAAASGLVLGLLLLAAAIAALTFGHAGAHWTAAVLGGAAAVSPWLLSFSAELAASYNALAVGLVAAALALWVLAKAGGFGDWGSDRLAH